MEQQVYVDIGRGWVKFMGPAGNLSRFPTVIGSPRSEGFKGIMGRSVALAGMTLTIEHPRFGLLQREVGENALKHSESHWSPRFRRQDEDDLVVLLSEALSRLDIYGEIALVVGVPAAFYDDQSETAWELFSKNEWKVNGQPVVVKQVRCLPQPMGAAYHMAVNADGTIREGIEAIAVGTLAVLDVGVYSTDGGVLKALEYQAGAFTIEVGMGKVAQAVARYLTKMGHPQLPHELDAVVQAREIRLDNEMHNLGSVINEVVAFGAKTILYEADALWPGRVNFDRVVIAGGGAYSFGSYIKEAWPNARVIDEPEWANVRGYRAFRNWTKVQG